MKILSRLTFKRILFVLFGKSHRPHNHIFVGKVGMWNNFVLKKAKLSIWQRYKIDQEAKKMINIYAASGIFHSKLNVSPKIRNLIRFFPNNSLGKIDQPKK